MSLGTNIYKLRTAKKLSQEDFAAAMEVSRQSVSKWENDMAVPELEKLIKMSKLFEISLDELVGNAPPQPKPEPVPAPVSTPAPGITTGDLLSIVLLVFTVVAVIGSLMVGSVWLVYICWILFPPLATVCAACCSPKSGILLGAYAIMNLLCIFMAMLFTGQFGVLLCLINIAPLAFWVHRYD